MSSILDRTDVPADVKRLSADELEALCADIRRMIIDTVSVTGGHLAANLGAVELTVAMLKVFDPPRDKLIWDVGHQTYAYKILTGRKSRFGTLRQYGGLSGFQRRDESEYDVFGAGHSGTALSAGLGMAAARDRMGGDENVVVVLGDAAAGCGISFEALNNLASTTDRIIVILNDNEMSISANVGSLSSYLGKLLASPRYNRLKSSVEHVGRWMRMTWFRQTYYRIEEAIKSLFLRSVIFEEFGLRYVGPIDGHNLPALIDALTVAGSYDKPILIHVSTVKGRGYAEAEAHPDKWHGTSGFDVATATPKKGGDRPTYSRIFGETLMRLAAKNPRITAITAAMPDGTGLKEFSERYPERFFDVGISEEHAVVFAAGLAAAGFVPVFAVYATFVQRAVDCVIHDVCLQGLPVVFCLDRAGVVGDDGPTHHGVFDIALLRPVPGLTIMQPRDEAELAAMVATAVDLGRPAVVRYPRGAGPGTAVPESSAPLEVGKAEIVKPGKAVQLWALGDMVPLAGEVAAIFESKGVSAGVVNARFVEPLDGDLLKQQAVEARVLVSLENGTVRGGFGSGIREYLEAEGITTPLVRCGWPNRFVPHGSPDSLRQECGLTPDAIFDRVNRVLGKSRD